MQMNNKEPAAADGKPPTTTICSRLQRAFQARPVFGPLRRLTGHPQDANGGVPAATHDGAPPPVLRPARAPAPSPVGKAPAPTAAAPVILPAAPQKPAAAKGGGKPGQVPGTGSTPTITSKVAEKAAGGIPVPVPPPAVMAGSTSADAKTGDRQQQTKGKIRVRSRVRKALASSK